jgi:hypothetical protein
MARGRQSKMLVLTCVFYSCILFGAPTVSGSLCSVRCLLHFCYQLLAEYRSCVVVPLLVVIHCTHVAMSRVVFLMWLLSLCCRFLLCCYAGSALECWVCYTAASDRSRSIGLV